MKICSKYLFQACFENFTQEVNKRRSPDKSKELENFLNINKWGGVAIRLVKVATIKLPLE